MVDSTDPSPLGEAYGDTAGRASPAALKEGRRPASAAAATSPILTVDVSSHRYGAGSGGLGAEVLRNIHFEATAGEFISIVGPSGCGKSTLLSLIAGLEHPVAGEITVAGQPVRGLRRDVGFVFQQDSLLPWKTLLGNAMLGLRYRRVAKREARARAGEWLARTGVGELADRYPHEVSGGQRKRAALAATLVCEPRLVLMDEPFSAIDVITRDYIETDILADWYRDKEQTFVFVTHDLEEAVAMSQRILIVSAGPGQIRADRRIPLPELRDVREIRSTEAFRETYAAVWEELREEVMAASQQRRGRQETPSSMPDAG